MIPSLFKVVTQAQWQQAQESGLIPPCGADRAHGHIHLNYYQSLEQVTNHYFSEADQPLALRLDGDRLAEHIQEFEATQEKPWPQPCATLPNLTLEMVTELLHFEFQPESGRFTLQE
ncbi:DUF952 domain-containing protein [Ferrimonas sediminicola]|uniref:DUF952 domain-containing protein n=1 Tax=Ferrimonas sediminicola TaxID=2569538 RepID=UPI00145DF9DA|nr:DUF952 domain-containing protein [Ferrimonas sediminicola]